MICVNCGEPVTDNEPSVPINDGADKLHRECLIRMVAGSVGHQLRTCSCFGGDEEDPKGATRREAARAAAHVAMALAEASK